MGYSAENVDYVSKLFSEEDVQRVVHGLNLSKEKKGEQHTIKYMLESMEKYGGDRWWLSENDSEVFNRQMGEKARLISIERLISLINSQLGENIESLDELSQKWESIRKKWLQRCNLTSVSV